MRLSPETRSRSRGGFTLVEVLVAAVVLVIGCLGLSAAISNSAQLLELNRERRLAHQAARAKLEEIASASFSEAFALYNPGRADDPVGGAPGAGFQVEGLAAVAGDTDGLPGEVVFPTVGGLGLQLTESFVDGRWGMPRDLNADSGVSAGALAGPYTILPVRVRIRWRGATGERTLELDAALLDHAH